jgi:hypothetical protein
MATWYVGVNDKIQEKVMQAADGDTIMLSATTFNENLDVYKPVKIFGAGKTSTIIQGSHKASVVKSSTWPLGTATINLSDTTGLEIGRVVTATGFPANARIVSINPNVSMTISANTTAARTTATNITMAHQTDATVRVRGGSASVFAEFKDLKVVGYNGVSPENPAIEYAAVYFRNTGLGSTACQFTVMDNCSIEANGEYGLLSDAASGVGNITIKDCYISGKTFVGDNPASGNQFSVANVPRQLVTFQSANGPITFINNTIEGVTGGMTELDVASFNTAVTVDAPNSVVTANTIKGTHGYGYALRVRGAGSTVENNNNYSLVGNTNAGFLIGPTGAQTSGMNIGTNKSIEQALLTIAQESAGQNVSVKVEKGQLKAISKVASNSTFNSETNWRMVGHIFKHDSSSKKLVVGIKSFDQDKPMKLKNGQSGEKYELKKIILSDSNKNLLVLKRDEIPSAASFDFTLK